MTLAKRTLKRAAAIALCLGTAQTPAWGDQMDDVQNLITRLAPIAGQQESSVAPEAAEVGGSTVYLMRAHSVDLEVYFALNKAALTARARADLAALGHALSSQSLAPYAYLIAGHTDSRGDARYNQTLSKRRADAVRRYLVDNFPIDPRRLLAVGWGESRLKTPADPTAAINRRVEVTLMVPAGGYVPPYDPENNAKAAPAAPPAAPTARQTQAAPAAPAAPTRPAAAPSPAAPLPGTMDADKDGNITITW